ncbi:MAG: RNA-guided pseudouridylation complex pseudouridine synthase subunit Cbf5 [Candidatus Nanohaloarchaea archaeon]
MNEKTWYTREEAETDPEFGSIPEKRPVEELLDKSFLIVDKPFGPTSNQVSYWIKEELNLKKAGHFGTLDPNATGILPVGLNSGTRINPALAHTDKEYIFEAEMNKERPEKEIKNTLQRFKGSNTQLPPEKSAVKKEERERQVYEVELLEKNGKKILSRVKCESGFYVRVLVDEMGEELGVDAEMTELRRTIQGPFKEKEADTIQDIVDAYHFYKEENREEEIRKVLRPLEQAVQHIPKIVVKDSAVNSVANGSDLGATGVSKLQGGIEEGEKVAVMTLKGELIALAEASMSSEEMYEEKGKAASPQNVYMDPGKYPKRWKQ